MLEEESNKKLSNFDKIENMLTLQQQLNDQTNGKNWQLGENKFGKEINWLRCIYMELAEMIDSTPWKHWKNIDSKPDIQNIHIELIDVWHFLMSYLLQETNIAKSAFLANNYCLFKIVKEDDINTKHLIRNAEKLLFTSLEIITKNTHTLNSFENLLDDFFECCKLSGLSFEWLYKLYIGKNCLNQFRQDNGYKEGTYIKIWNGKEDNVIMTNILKNENDINFDILYQALKNEYAKHTK